MSKGIDEMTSIEVTKCPVGYAWGYVPTGSHQKVEELGDDTKLVRSAFIQWHNFIKRKHKLSSR